MPQCSYPLTLSTNVSLFLLDSGTKLSNSSQDREVILSIPITDCSTVLSVVHPTLSARSLILRSLTLSTVFNKTRNVPFTSFFVVFALLLFAAAHIAHGLFAFGFWRLARCSLLDCSLRRCDRICDAATSI
jgi:hypothetical protein